MLDRLRDLFKAVHGHEDYESCLLCPAGRAMHPISELTARQRVVKESDADEDHPAGTTETVYLCREHLPQYDANPF